MGMDTKLLKQKILDLAIRGKLVPQDPNDEPASVLLERIRAEREKLIAEGKLKRTKTTSDNRHYENVPFEIPESWEWVKLSEIASFGGGKTPSMAKKAYWQNGNNLWVTSKDMKSDRISDSKLKISDEALSIMTVYEPGTLLLVTRSGILRHSMPLAILEKQATVNQDIKTISLFVSELNEFVYYSIKARESFILKDYHKDGTTVDSIDFDKFSNILLPIPPLNEQIRIVNMIGRLFSSIDEIKQNKTDIQDIVNKTKTKILDLAIHGKLVEQYPNDEPASELLKRIAPNATLWDNSQYENLPQGWVVCKLEDIVDYEQPTQYLVQSTNYSDNYKTPVLTAGKSFILGYTNETTGIFDKLPTIIFDDFTTDSRFVDFPFKVKSSAMKLLQVNKEINIRYVAYFMSITRLVGDTHKRYWISEYSKIPIPLPPIKEQNRIVQAIQDIEAKLNEITTEL